MVRTTYQILAVLAILVVMLVGCRQATPLQNALQLSGQNRCELERVLTHYQDSGLKYDAARFLIENMIGKGSVALSVTGPSGVPINLEDIDTCHLKDYLAELTIKNQEPRSDLEYISAEFLIENIDIAFQARQRYPWCAALPFDEFCRHVLPHRIKFEPLEHWRRHYMDRYGSIADSLAKTGASMYQVVFYINVHYGKRYIKEMDRLSGDLSFRTVEHLGGGTCDHLALHTAIVMRALGIPIHYDRLPYHGRVNGGHAYNSFKDVNKGLVFFSPYDRDPARNRWVAPLVQRICYELQPEASLKKNRWNKMLSSPMLSNVTKEYYPTSRIIYPMPNVEPESWVALATYNRGELHLVNQTMTTTDHTAVFDLVSQNLLYFIVYERDNQLQCAGAPFILNLDGSIELIGQTTPVRVTGVRLYDANRIIPPLATESYTLCLWDEGQWTECSKMIVSDSATLYCEKQQRDGLFLIRTIDASIVKQRPFRITIRGIEYF